jgi:Cd2+/Zn2+-exporting ATPase
VFVAIDGRAAGIIAIADTLKAGSAAAVAELHRLGLTVVMLTGDNETTARAIAAEAGVDRVVADVRPDEKAAQIRALQAEGRAVAMVGDGVNDAPALAAADIGIAMGAAGTDAALETADVALMSDDLMAVPGFFRLGRATVRNIRANVAVALGLKAAFLALAVAGVATLWMAVAADMGASLLVIANGLRLLRPDSRRAG